MKKIVFFIVLVLCNIVTDGQPCTQVKELNRKHHKIEGSTYGHPYTMFDRHNGKAFTETIDSIRSRIKNEKSTKGTVYTAYQLLYTFASSAMPTDNGMHNEAASGLALWAKNNAFVMLIGLNGNGDTLTLSDRENRKNNVLHAFNNLNAAQVLNFAGVERYIKNFT